MTSAPVKSQGYGKETSCDEIVIREPLYVFAVSNLMAASTDEVNEFVY